MKKMLQGDACLIMQVRSITLQFTKTCDATLGISAIFVNHVK